MTEDETGRSRLPTDRYLRPGPFTALDAAQLRLIDGLPDSPARICAAVQRLVIQPDDAIAAGIPESRLEEKNIRPASALVRVLTVIDPAGLDKPRVPAKRVVGTCRHFAVLSRALLQSRGYAARARCGFATYFMPGRNVDHWITEYWHTGEKRWVRIDTEILGQQLVGDPSDLDVGEFLTGGEAWTRYRCGQADGQSFGVAGVDYAWGPAEIRGNAMRDLAALCQREMLPWDEWGRMEESYQGRTGPDFDRLIDAMATTCASDDHAAIARLYASEDLAVPEEMTA